MLKSAPFEAILPLLVTTYQQGHLVPFLGAGMSTPFLTLWPAFLDRLEQTAGIGHGECVTPDARAQRACSVIQNREGRSGLLRSVQDALRTANLDVPLSTVNLAQIRWPLAVSTNYDDLFYYACHCRRDSTDVWQDEMAVQVLGRSSRDCKLVVSSLTGPSDRQYIWHIQGFLGGQSPSAVHHHSITDLGSLQDQLVIGHAEYRRVTNRAPDFRRCFAEVFNSRSFLFLGSSLREEYFLNLFGEVLDLCGPSAVPHFAFTEEGHVDAGFLADQMNITVCEFPKEQWSELPRWLARLKAELDAPRARSVAWSYAMDSRAQNASRLEIIRGDAPTTVGAREAIAFVAPCKDDTPVPPPNFAALQTVRPEKLSDHVFYYRDQRTFSVTARVHGGTDDDMAVYSATRDLLTNITAIDDTNATVHFQFSATRGSVPPVYGFMEAVRTFAQWRRDSGDNRALRLIMYVQADVELSLTSGRVDIRELLTSKLIRFWAVVVSIKTEEPVRRALHVSPDTKISDVLEMLAVPANSSDWFISVCPSPRKKIWLRSTRDVESLTIVQIGIVFGSVLILEHKSQCAAGRTE